MQLGELIIATGAADCPPPLFALPLDDGLYTRGPDPGIWQRAGYSDGLDCWRSMCAATGPPREESLIGWDIWDELLQAELIRRALYAESLQRRRGTDRTIGDYQAAMAADLKLSSEDMWHWADHWCRIEDTLASDPEMVDAPLLMWPAQRAVWAHLCKRYGEASRDNRISEIWVKGRELGVTWIMVAWETWRWLIERRFSCKLGSRVFEDADNRTTESLLGKSRYIIDRQPAHLLPEYPGRCPNRPARHDREGKLINNWTRARTTARHTTRDFGRGGRAKVVMFDEFGRVLPREQEEVRSSMATVSLLEILFSTPSGKTNRFAWEAAQKPDQSRLDLPWTYDPRRDRHWWDSELIEHGGKLTAAEREQEHNCSFQGISSEHIWTAPEECLYDDDTPEFAELRARDRMPHTGGMDFGTGPAATTYWDMIEDWDAGMDTALGRLPRIWLDLALEWHRTQEHEIAAEIVDQTREYRGTWRCYGDPAGASVGVEQLTSMGQIRGGGVPVVKAHQEMTDWAGEDKRIGHLQEMIRLGLFRVHRRRAARAWTALTAWRWNVPSGARLAMLSRDVIRPRKDDHSHHCEAGLYALDGILRWHQPMVGDRRPPSQRRRKIAGDPLRRAAGHFA